MRVEKNKKTTTPPTFSFGDAPVSLCPSIFVSRKLGIEGRFGCVWTALTQGIMAATPILTREMSVISEDEKKTTSRSITQDIVSLIDGYVDPEDGGNNSDHRYYIPSIQRVWSWKGKLGAKKQNMLLNTIFRGLPIPSIILGKVRGDHGGDRYAVYDGRHRLRTLSMFIRNAIPYKIVSGPEEGTAVYYKDLSPLDKYKFDTYQISTIIIQGTDKDIESEIFVRTNLGKPLTSSQMCYADIESDNLFGRTAKLLRLNAPRISEVFGQDFRKTDVMRRFISHWSGFVLAASRKNSGLATTAYPRLEDKKDVADWDDGFVNHAFDSVLTLYTKVKEVCTFKDSDLKKFMTLGNVNAFFLHDLIHTPVHSASSVIEKWVHIIKKVYLYPLIHGVVLRVTGAQNLNSSKIAIVMRQIREHDWSSETASASSSDSLVDILDDDGHCVS